MGQDSLGVLAAHGQQLVHREGGGAEDGLEGDGVDALSPQLTQRGQRGPEGGREPPDADGEGIAALGARVGRWPSLSVTTRPGKTDSCTEASAEPPPEEEVSAGTG